MNRTIFLLALASFGGVAVLQVVANTTDPPIVPIPELPLHAGTTVRVEGRLIAVKEFDGGFARGLLAQSNRSVPLIGNQGFDASPGDAVIVEVRVLQENGRIELELEHAGDLVVATAWRDGHVSLERVLSDPWSYRESNIRTSGMLERDSRGLWLRADNDARVTLVKVPTHAMIDTKILVDGLLSYAPEHGAFRLHVRDLVLEE